MREKKEKILEEQKAPLKNTDHAFVRVNKDGSPEFSRPSEERGSKEKQSDKQTRREKP